MKENALNATVIAQSKSDVKKMSVEDVNNINTKLAEVIKTLSPFEGLGIETAIKDLKKAGKNISDHFYRIGEEENE